MTTLRSLERWSEPFPATGGVTAIGVKNALGRPRMDLPTLLVRETVQNSWDAGERTGIRPIRFQIDAWTMEGEMLEVLRTAVLAGGPVPGLPLSSVLEGRVLPVIVISDRGTAGLGGATRADIVTEDASDFADFVRNVGRPPDKQRGGGTYGYGKAVLFLASSASTIVAYTRCVVEGRSESRLVVIGLGEPFSVPVDGGERLYTGRHWWGVLDPEAGVEPITGNTADEIATQIGLPSFDGDHGTSIMIVGADFGELDLAAAVAEMREAILWHCWPKMLASEAAPCDMEFHLSFAGDPQPVPLPTDHPELKAFVEAYRVSSGLETRSVISSRLEIIRSERPRNELGRLGIVQVFRDPRLPDRVAGRPFEGPAHHVALMRAPRLVVTYVPGPEPPVQGVAWAGAFIVNDNLDRAFAAAEPPSHDDWSPDILPRSPEKTFVNVALRNIRDAVKQFASPPPVSSEPGAVLPLAGIAAALGGILAADHGPGTRIVLGSAGSEGGDSVRGHGEQEGSGTRGGGAAGSGGGPAGGGEPSTGGDVRSPRGRRRHARIEVLAHRLVMDEAGPAIEVTFDALPAEEAVRTRIRAISSVTVNDGATIEREAPVGADVPQVLRWEVGGRSFRSQDVVLEGSAPVRGTLLVTVPRDTTVAVSLAAESGEPVEGQP
ncbi:MAG TPA: hypothetical protein VHG28_07550 [Longimicrobiaceae bacterium]|nr:hypothetical protein [Longimicrobiaceae bacterium]